MKLGINRTYAVLPRYAFLTKNKYYVSPKKNDQIKIDDKYVTKQIGEIYKNNDLSKFIL